MVLRFASGLSPKVGDFLCQHHIKGKTFDEVFMSILRENEMFCSGIFQKIPGAERIDLDDAHLNEAEIRSLLRAAHDGKLQKIVELTLTSNNMTGWLKHLFNGHDSLRFPRLRKMDLSNTELNTEDVESLSKAVREGQFPQLQNLDLSMNKLTGCMSSLVGGRDHPGFAGLNELNLGFADLNEKDVEDLCNAVRARKFPQLKDLHLPSNALSGSGIHRLTSVITEDKLPHLNNLNLGYNELSHMESEVEALIAACDAHCENQLGLQLWETGLSEEFTQRCEDKYRNVPIHW